MCELAFKLVDGGVNVKFRGQYNRTYGITNDSVDSIYNDIYTGEAGSTATYNYASPLPVFVPLDTSTCASIDSLNLAGFVQGPNNTPIANVFLQREASFCNGANGLQTSAGSCECAAGYSGADCTTQCAGLGVRSEDNTTCLCDDPLRSGDACSCTAGYVENDDDGTCLPCVANGGTVAYQNSDYDHLPADYVGGYGRYAAAEYCCSGGYSNVNYGLGYTEYVGGGGVAECGTYGTDL